ncbi:MAG TPA: hypothetical protein VL283_03390 [Candidatus Baltobacteraceae bacterium]|nr:hypothetical protein [Candidatus Baltobacteraceae bacterium]
MSYEEIVKQLEEYHVALATEDRLARTGLTAKPDFTSIREKYAELFTDQSIATVRELIERAAAPRRRDQMERTLFALLEGMIAAGTLKIEEQILAKAASLSAAVDGRDVGFHELTALIGAEQDPAKREEIRRAQAALAEELAPLRLEHEHALRQKLSGFGFGTLREYAETKKRIRYDVFLQKALPILEETTGLYRRVMGDAVRRAYGKELGDISAAHVHHWRAGREFDHLFPPDKIMPLCAGAFATIGLPFEHAHEIRIDAEPRPGKHPRAICYAPRAPSEIHLILKPQGGFEDVRSFLHEGGHALHFAHVDPALPYEWRGLPRSHALAETFAFLIGHLPENPLWLEHVMHVPKAAAERLAAWALLGNLFMLRRYMAKFTYELAFDEKPFDAARNRELYSKTLKDLTGFAYEPEFWLEDMDGGFYSADYLRAWIASAQVEEHLVRKYGDRWFLKRDTGIFLKAQFARGVSIDAEELVQDLGMTAWDPLPLIRKFDGVSRLLR